jgi:hypothetical protein
LGYGIFAILFLGIWDMCPLNYWDMGYCIVIWGIFRDIFGLLTENQFQEYGIFAFFVLGIWDIDTLSPLP